MNCNIRSQFALWIILLSLINEIWLFIQKEEHKLQGIESKDLRNIFECK